MSAATSATTRAFPIAPENILSPGFQPHDAEGAKDKSSFSRDAQAQSVCLSYNEHDSSNMHLKRAYTGVSNGDADQSSSQGSSIEGAGNIIYDAALVTNHDSALPSKRRCLEEGTRTSCAYSTELTKNAPVNETILNVEDGSSIKVSRPVLMEVPYFSALFSKDSERSSYELVGDASHAVQILMSILHHKPSQLPASVSAKQLFDLATITSKYDVIDIIAAQVECQTWFSELWFHDRPKNGDWVTWLWILHTFHKTEQDHRRYRRVLEILAASMTFRNGLWELGRAEYQLQFSHIESAYDKEILNDILESRIGTLWREFRVACYRERRILEHRQDQDFYTIGVFGTFLGQQPDEYTSELSLAETLQTIVPDNWPSPAVNLIAGFVKPWAERFKIYD